MSEHIPDFMPYAVGIGSASVCTSLDDAETTRRLNLAYPTGIAPWAIAEDATFADGVSPNPCPCHDAPDTHRHVLFHC